MYSFSVQNRIGHVIEEAFETLLSDAGLPWARNPFTGTEDERRKDYDIRVGQALVECKANPATTKTGNICLETDILENSKAHYFLIAFPVVGGWHGHVLDRTDIETLLKATKLTFQGRTWKYKRVPAGQYHQENMLVPTTELTNYGVGVVEFIADQVERQLTV